MEGAGTEAAHAVVPMRVHAHVLREPMMVVAGAMAFDRLPFYDGTRDVNSGVPYLSDAIASRPFQDLNFELRRGVHLHWVLPTAWRTAEHDADGLTYPHTPTRWLVTRSVVGSDEDRPTSWVVESDYLYPEGKERRPDEVTFPVAIDPAAGRHQPFRYVGRAVPLDQWRPFDVDAEYLGGLTSIGYGDPTFSAFYPSCHSVFGFHETAVPDAAIRYDVIGWYANPADDLARHHRRQLAAELGRAPNAAELRASFASRLHLDIATGTSGDVPDHTLLAGQVVVAPDDLRPQPPFPSIVVAPSGAEAVGAFATRDQDPAVAEQMEEQVDYMLLGSAIDVEHVDVGITFNEVSHRQSFGVVPGGSAWRIVPVSDASTPADATTTQGRLAPDDAAANELDRLNALQREADHADQRRQAVAGQLFADWHKWMQSQYSPGADASADLLPDADRIMDLIERQDLADHDALGRERTRLGARIATAVE
ncbi:MAG: hypothetical protein QOG64_1731, partial [Acidimicrobiaceae bacterium]|nr:hypothetical protein [Acidimicrobiaceae bacterium]